MKKSFLLMSLVVFFLGVQPVVWATSNSGNDFVNQETVVENSVNDNVLEKVDSSYWKEII